MKAISYGEHYCISILNVNMAYKINYLNKTKIQQKLMDIQIIERVLNP
jgi:hypothetical protein